MAQEWRPPAWMYRERRPPNDSAYYENMTRCIFQAGLSWRTVSDKWPAFQKAFDGFDTSKVAEYGAGDISRLMGDAGIIRNRRKILAAIHNAREFERIAAEHGSFQRWLDSLDKSNNYNAVLKRLSSTFKHMGPTTSHIFLYTVGEDIKRMEE
jgi:DNA-3-methyladenine glycosylase I